MFNGQWSMVKNAIKRAQSRTCSSYAEREHFRRSQWSILNGQWSMVNPQWSMVNGQSSMLNAQ